MHNGDKENSQHFFFNPGDRRERWTLNKHKHREFKIKIQKQDAGWPRAMQEARVGGDRGASSSLVSGLIVFVLFWNKDKEYGHADDLTELELAEGNGLCLYFPKWLALAFLRNLGGYATALT